MFQIYIFLYICLYACSYKNILVCGKCALAVDWQGSVCTNDPICSKNGLLVNVDKSGVQHNITSFCEEPKATKLIQAEISYLSLQSIATVSENVFLSYYIVLPFHECNPKMSCLQVLSLLVSSSSSTKTSTTLHPATLPRSINSNSSVTPLASVNSPFIAMLRRRCSQCTWFGMLRWKFFWRPMRAPPLCPTWNVFLIFFSVFS